MWNYDLVNLHTFVVNMAILLVYWFLLHTVSWFYLFVVVFWLSKHSHHWFTYQRISKNQYQYHYINKNINIIRISKKESMWFMFYIFSRSYFSCLFLYLTLDHSHPFSSVPSRFQSGPYVPCLDIFSILRCLAALIYSVKGNILSKKSQHHSWILKLK